MVSEFLFGELLDSDEEFKDWIHIAPPAREEEPDLFTVIPSFPAGSREKLEGWVLKSSVTEVDDAYCESYISIQESGSMPVVRDRVAIVHNCNSYGSIVIPVNSMIPEYNAADSSFTIGTDRYEFLTPFAHEETSAVEEAEIRKKIYRTALEFIGAPFRWRGLTPWGTDSEGLVYSILRNNVQNAPFTFQECMKYGTILSFMEEASIGDILLFSDTSGDVSHSGIYLGGDRVIHASGNVKIDRIDHQGIFANDMKRYTHPLGMIISLF